MTAGTLIMMGAEELRALLADERRRTVEEVRQIVADRADEELLAPKDAAAAVGMTPGAFRQAMAADAELRRRFVGTGRALRIKRRDAREWFAARKVRRRAAGDLR